MKEWPTAPTSVWINATGVGKDGENQPFITWDETTNTKWRFIYTRDSYQINTATKAYLFSFTNPYTAKKEEMAYVMSSGVSKGAQLAGSAYIGINNMKDIDILQALHIYARCYVKQGVSFWHNKFEEIFFKFMFAIMASFAIMTLQYSTLSVIYPGPKNFGFVMEIAPVIACAYFVYIALKDLVNLRKSIVNNI